MFPLGLDEAAGDVTDLVESGVPLDAAVERIADRYGLETSDLLEHVHHGN